MANGDVFRVGLTSNDGVRQYYNTFHYADDSGGSVHFDCNLFASDWWTAWTPNLLPAAVTDINFTLVTVQCLIGPNAGDVGEYGINAGNTGTFAAPDLPPELCIAITRKVPKAGRKYRGRMFWGPLASSMFTIVERGEVNTGLGALTALTGILSSSFTTQTVGLDPVLVHASPKPVVYTRTPGIITVSVISPISVHRKKRRIKLAV